MTDLELQNCLDTAKNCAEAAGKLVLSIYQSGDFKHLQKADQSPVTCADIAAHDFIQEYLATHTPNLPLMSEEQVHLPLSERQSWQSYWLVDPIDGTQEFVSKSGDFSVSIALVSDNLPVIGVIYWPTQGIMYYAIAGAGAWKAWDGQVQRIKVRRFESPDNDLITLAVSRVQPLERVMRHLTDQRTYNTFKRGSCSLKACAIAEGTADIYMRVGITGEWDTGAAQCIVSEAGGKIVDRGFSPLSYNQREQLTNPDFFILGDQTLDWQHIIKSQAELN